MRRWFSEVRWSRSVAALGAAVALATVALTPGCWGDGFDPRAMITSLVVVVIEPSHEEFAAKAAALDDASRRLCAGADAAPSAGDLESARAAWRAARTAWIHLEPFAFGPATVQPWRLGPSIDKWPVRVASVRDVLDAAPGFDGPLDDAAVASLGASRKGLSVVELLLFSDSDLAASASTDSDGATRALAAFDPARSPTAQRRCDYLTGLTADLNTQATALREAWARDGDDFMGAMIHAGPGQPRYMSLNAATSDLVGGLIVTVERTERDRLARPLGLVAGSDARPDSAESRFSHTGNEDVLAALDAVQRVYEGRLAGVQGVGVADWLRHRRPSLDPKIERALEDSRAAVDAIGAPIDEAVLGAPERVHAAYDAVMALRVLLDVQLAQALEASVTFSDTDGD